jgi:hypothetical protein
MTAAAAGRIIALAAAVVAVVVRQLGDMGFCRVRIIQIPACRMGRQRLRGFTSVPAAAADVQRWAEEMVLVGMVVVLSIFRLKLYRTLETLGRTDKMVQVQAGRAAAAAPAAR